MKLEIHQVAKDKFDMSTFAPKLQALCAKAMADNRTPEDAAEVIEALLSSLAFSVSLACAGDGKAMDNFIEGSIHYLTVRCGEHQKAGKVLGQFMRGNQ